MKAKRNLWIYSLLFIIFIGASIVIYINYKSPNNSKATLISVTAQSDEAKVKLLITNGAQINATDSQGRTALMAASSKGNTAIVKLLLEQGADTNLKDNKGQTAFTRASNKGHRDIMKLLDQTKPTGSAPINPDAATLINASDKGDEAIVMEMIEKCNEINTNDQQGWTALMKASAKGHANIVKLLLNNGADISAMLPDGRSANDLAKNDDILKLLRENIPDLFENNKKIQSAKRFH